MHAINVWNEGDVTFSVCCHWYCICHSTKTIFNHNSCKQNENSYEILSFSQDQLQIETFIYGIQVQEEVEKKKKIHVWL